ncbi:FHA domain-containing protein [Chondromyces apiculatus]|nr:FHA domain-containing protein [Chondromyces apiculatus]
MGPLTVGSGGAWVVKGPGIAPEHAELYFDGAELFVRSVNMAVPAVVGGQPVLAAWMPLAVPSEIMLGGVRLWFGPDPAAQNYAPMNSVQLLEDDDNVATRVADQAKENAWGDVGDMVRRGMEMSRAQAESVKAPPPVPPPPEVPSFWPAAAASAAAPVAEEVSGPSMTKRTDDSGMTKIEPMENIERRREVSMAGRRYGGDASMSGTHHPSAAHLSAGAPLSMSGSNYPQATAGGLGRTEVLSGSQMPPMSSVPGSGVPSFGAPPPVPSFGAPPSAAPPPLDGNFARLTGTHQQVLPSPLTTQNARLEQGISVEGVSRAAQGGRKSAWQELSGPKKMMVFLSPLLLAAVVVLFLGEELGLTPKAPGPAATTQAQAPEKPAPTAVPAAPTEAPGEPTPAPSAGGPPSAAPTAGEPNTPPPLPPEPAQDSPPPQATASIAAPTPPPLPASQGAQPAKSDGTKSLQRLAADAVAAGSYARAAELYQQLARANPNRPAYAEAAEIMRAKAGLK